MSFIRLTEQASDPPQPSEEGQGAGAKKTMRLFAFDDSGTTVVKAIDSDGNVFDFVGPQGPQGDTGPTGPQGPAGSAMKQAVADIDDPSSELASVGGVIGDLMVVYEDADPAESTFYVFDDSVTAPNNSPYIVAGSGGKWIAAAGKYQNGNKSVLGTLGIDGNITVTGTVDGRDVATDGAKLDGIEAGAEVNDPFADAAPPDITDSTGAVGSTVEMAREDHTHAHGNRGGGALHAVVTVSVNGFMSSADKTKLDGIAAGATNTPLADAAPPDITDSTGAVGSATEAAREDHTHGHGNRGGGTLHAAATGSVAGFMSAADKAKLDSVPNFDPNIETQIIEEFSPNNSDSDELGTNGWRRTSTGTGNVGTMIDGEANHPGIYRMGSGTAAAARSTIYLGEPGNDLVVLASGEILYDCIVRGTGAIGNFERMLAGLAQRVTTNAEWTEGVYWRILTGGTNWELVAASGGVRSTADSGIAYTTGNWIRLGFTINAAGTSIQGRINGSNVGSAITTNIPTVAISPVFLSGALAAGGGSNSTLDADYMRTILRYSGNRHD